MKSNDTGLQRSLGRLLTAIQAEEMRAIDTPAWGAAHMALERVESLYWASKHASLAVTLGTQPLREFLGVEWISRHPRVLPNLQDLELWLDDIESQA
jgi:hypothetical protein